MLENKDISLVHSMISLGSCTMKLTSTTEMMVCRLTYYVVICFRDSSVIGSVCQVIKFLLAVAV